MRILICDDSMFMRKLLKDSFKRISSNIEIVGEASNGIEAFEKYKELQPDLITLDITMELKNGLSALKDIMEYDNNANVVMVSSMGQKRFVLEALSLGAFDFIIKPFKDDTLIKIINRFQLERKKFS